MKTLSTEHRRQLERTVVEARDIAEAGARGALEGLAVHHHEPYGHMSGEQRKLRNRLRAHARHLGDRVDARSGAHAIDHLVHECAYEHWHGMLFARFLAENHLLIEPEMGVAITLDECEELAKEEGVDKWALAARFAHRMLPQVFRPDHPVFEIQFAREYRLKLESLVEALPEQVFTATDALGWVYQFWQTKKKDEVNRSEVKIGADELPAVTQLFTEPYMVQFLLHNSLGAWWVSRHPDKACPVDLTYLRRSEDGKPAAGAFEGWPDDLAEFRLLDPCCGSGHFLVTALLILTPMRIELEGLDATEAVDAVLKENIHGLELDQRCVAIAAFALALEAWRFADAGGFRTLPKLNLAWCGQPVAGKKEQWLALAERDERLEAGMASLYETFRDAPILGSLIDPARSVSEDMLTAGFDELQPLLEKALRVHAGEEEWEETAIAALGLAESTRILSSRYDLVITNVPYLGRGKHNKTLQDYCERLHPRAKADLATCFVERSLKFSRSGGVASLVAPQNWWFIKSYSAFRKHLLETSTFHLIATLGEEAWQTFGNRGPVAGLVVIRAQRPNKHSKLFGIDALPRPTIGEKSNELASGDLTALVQHEQLQAPDHRISVFRSSGETLLADFADSYQGIKSGDDSRFCRGFWEMPRIDESIWRPLQSSPSSDQLFGGMELLIFWGDEGASLARRQGVAAWNRRGVLVTQMRSLYATLYFGERFAGIASAIVAKDESDVPAIWAYCSSSEYKDEVRKIDSRVSISNGNLVNVGFDLAHWRKVANESYPEGLPVPTSNDPTQLFFDGYPKSSSDTLQVSVARLLGYQWPRKTGSEFPDCPQLEDDALEKLADDDGVVCLSSVRGERPAHERLLQLLHTVYGEDWYDGIVTKLLAESGCNSLEDWLRNQFFDEHCKLFQHRPFIWHIWDGRKRDGFHALVNYHKLAEGDGKGRRLLESLTYSYLGDWIARQEDGVKRCEGGAEDRLAAARELQKRLIAILEGEPPFDVFVRWKPIEEQSIGWEPDINDGVRVNIRPFMAQDLPGGKKGAGILRGKPNIHWKKDRGKEPTRDQAQFPWFWKNGKFTGERVNDVHLTNAEKRAAREAAGTAAKGK